MDNDAQLEEVKIYGAETGELKYVFEGDFLNDFYDIRTVDADMDGCYEIYVPYIVEDSFKVGQGYYRIFFKK